MYTNYDNHISRFPYKVGDLIYVLWYVPGGRRQDNAVVTRIAMMKHDPEIVYCMWIQCEGSKTETVVNPGICTKRLL